MSLLSPNLVWAFLVLIPLAAIYFLKVRPRTRTTTAYFLWEKVLSKRRSTSLFNRLRDLLSLLLMSLALSALALALCRPQLGTDDRKDLLILIDHSASMSASDGMGSRLDTAKDAAREIAIALNGNQRAAVASLASKMEFRSHLSVSPRQLIDAIDNVQQTNFAFSKATVEALGNNADWASAAYRIILISDGSFAGVESLPSNIEFLKIGSPAQNIGIISADLQLLPDGRMGFYFQVASSFKKKIQADLVLKMAETGQVYKVIPLEVAPGVNESETFYLDAAPTGNWIAEVDLQDGFAKDNRAWLVVPPLRPVRVAVNAKNRFFFENSILAFQRGGGTLQLVDDSPDIVVEQGQSSGDNELAVIFTPQGTAPWWRAVGEERKSISPREVVDDHPVLRYVDLSEVAFAGAKEIKPSKDALVLVESEDGNPLIFQATSDGKTALVVNLDPLASNLYFSAWFPVIVHGAATHLAGRAESLAPTYRPEDRVSIPGFQENTETTLLSPSSEVPITVRTAPYGPLSELGHFEFQNAAGTWPVSSSLVRRAETMLDNERVEDSTRPISRGNSPSHWLIVLALLILVGESILYQRRRVG